MINNNSPINLNEADKFNNCILGYGHFNSIQRTHKIFKICERFK